MKNYSKYINIKFLKLLLLIVTVIVINFCLKSNFKIINKILSVINYDTCVNNHKTVANELFKMSKILTESMRKIGRNSCKYSSNKVSTNGGWCAEISGENSSQHYFDPSLAQRLALFLAGKYYILLTHRTV